MDAIVIGDQHDRHLAMRLPRNPQLTAASPASYCPVMDRRRFLLTSLAGALGAPLAAEAQPASGIPRIGYLSLNLRAGDTRSREGFFRGLRDLGYVEGTNLVIEYRDAEGRPDRFPRLAAELAALKVSVIFTGGGTLGAMAAKQATSTIPIVFGATGDPVSEGLVTSLARGLAAMSPAWRSTRRSWPASRWSCSSRPCRGSPRWRCS
jgi:hypothetical protein